MNTYLTHIEVPESVRAFFAALAPLGVVTYMAPSTYARVRVTDTEDLYDLALRARDVEVAVGQIVGARYTLPRPTDTVIGGNGLVYKAEITDDVRTFFDAITGLAAVPDFIPTETKVEVLFEAENDYDLAMLVSEVQDSLKPYFFGVTIERPEPLTV